MLFLKKINIPISLFSGIKYPIFRDAKKTPFMGIDMN
jgi:hypothetical protein